MTLNDAILAATGGPTVNDGLRAYYNAQGVPYGALQDMERAFLRIQMPAAEGSNQDLWMQYLSGVWGYEGTLNDMLYQYWLAGASIGLSWQDMVDLYFSNGEQGVIYPLNPAEGCVFQDSTGTIPCTGPDQPVGLVLDVHIGATVNIVASDFVKTSGDGVVTIIGNTITITGATTQTDVRTDLFNGYATADVTCTIAGSTGAAIYAGGAPKSLTNGHNVISGYNQYVPQLNIIRVVTGTISVTINSWTCLSGNHASHPTTTKRPMLGREPFGGRRNLLTYTEDFANAVWTKTEMSVTANPTAAPDGSTPAETLTPTIVSGAHTVAQTSTASISGPITQSVYVKANGYNFFALTFDNSSNLAAFFNLETLAVTNVGAGVTNTSIEDVGNGWRRVSISVGTAISFIRNYVTPTASFEAYAGDGTSGVFIWGAQLELGSTATPYQKVVSSFDVTEAGVPDCWYIQGDGVDDFMYTGNIDFTGTDKMTVWAGVGKTSNSVAIISELSSNSNSNDGSFFHIANTSPAGLQASSRGTAAAATNQAATATGYPVVDTSVSTATHDIAASLTTIYRNGVASTPATGAKGSGNFGNYPLNLLAQNGTAYFFSGNLYSLMIRGAETTDLTPGNEYTAALTGVTLP